MKNIIKLLLLVFMTVLFATSVFAAEENVVFVSDNGSDLGDGTTADAPFKTLATAYDFVSKGGTVVVCGPLTLSGDALKLPNATGEVTITSLYRNINYAESGAVLNLGGYTYLNGDTVFENIKINDSSSFYFNQLICQGNSLTVGDGVTCTREYGEYITIIGGQYISSASMTATDVSFYDYTITVNSGIWFMINGSNKRTANESAMGATGGVSIIINGGSFTGKAANQADAMISAGGYASQDGDYYIEINGGVFNTPIIAVARPGNNSGRYTAYYEGDVHIKITGGEFRGATITTVQSEAASYIGGNYTLEIDGGAFTSLEKISAVRVRGTSACRVSSEVQNYLSGFDTIGDISVNEKIDNMPSVKAGEGVVFLGGGEGEGDGANSRSPVNSIEKAMSYLGDKGGTIVVCTPIRIESATLPNISGKITVTSVYGGKDFRKINGAQIQLKGILTLGCETLFESVDFQSRSLASYIFCAGHSATFGNDINCTIHMDGGVTEHIGIFTGDRLVTTSDRALGKSPTAITIQSGQWRFLRAGNERAHGGENTLRTVSGDNIINISGGTFHEDVCGTGKNNLDGSITLNISGGEFLCSIFGMATPANVDNDMSVVNGNITVNISGGKFHGDIAVVQNTAKNTLNGLYTLNITGGDFRAVGAVTGTEGVTGSNSSILASAIDFTVPSSGEMTFTNPIIGYGADPSVYYHDGWYYYVRATTTGSSQSISISRAANIFDIGNTAAKVVYIADDFIKSIWAPQVYCFDGEWYIYFSGCASTSSSAQRTPYVLKANEPLGTYTMLGAMENMDADIYSWLSPRIFEYRDTRYYISSVFASADDNTSSKHKQTLVIGKLSSPTSFDGEVSVIATPDKSWEGYDIIEGPFSVYGSDGTLYIAYTANYADGDDYCTGLLKLTGENLMSAESWEKQLRPMQQRDEENLIFAPGATVFVQSPDESEVYAVYHAKLHANNRYNRSIFVQKLDYKDGVPYLGAPPSIDTVITFNVNSMPVSERISGFGEGNKFSATRTYSDQFTDVDANQWFYTYVKTAYEYALANGTSATKFSPYSKFTVAQALTAAANIHAAYAGGSVSVAESREAWYTPYVNYCIANSIIADGQYTDYNRGITRGEMAIVFANILPDSEYEAVRTGANPDVTPAMECYTAVQKLYNAGIVGGDAGTGNYRPNDEISRSEACVIFTRIAAKEFRAK